MNFITKKHLSRRTLLRGTGAMIALPLLDAMIPASTFAAGRVKAVRTGFIYLPNGVARDDLRGERLTNNLDFWTPKETATGMELSRVLQPLQPVQDHMVVVTGLSHLKAFSLGDGNGDHSRASATWLNGVHPLKSEGKVRAHTTIDQILADHLGRDTRLPSLEIISSNIEAGIGNCENGYSCAYLNTVSWRTDTIPVPPENNPRAVFDRLFGGARSADARRAEFQRDESVLDQVQETSLQLRQSIGASDRARLAEYLDSIREVERRIQNAETIDAATLPENLDRPPGIPATFQEHARLMYQLLALTYQADVTRCFAFMLGRELQQRTYPEIGVNENHHSLSHHGNDPQKIDKLAKINLLQAELFSDFVQKLRATPEGDGNLLDNTFLVYGGGMSNPNEHNHIDLPVVLVNGKIKGNRMVRYELKTPMSNLLVSILDRFGAPVSDFGDSSGRLLSPDPLAGIPTLKA